MFQLNSDEKAEVVANCDHLSKLKFSPVLPYAFTEHGAIMAASVLNTPRAIEASVFVVRAFVKLREMISNHNLVADRIRFALTRYFYRKSQVADVSSFVILVPLGDGKRIFLEKKFLSCDHI